MSTRFGPSEVGALLLMGGGEDPDENRLRLLPRLVQMAGGKKARILLCGAPSTEPEAKLEAYQPLFERLGVHETIFVPIHDREEACSEGSLEAIERATAIFFPGGDQLRIATMLAGTPFALRLEARFREDGMVIAGTSAGAAVVSDTIVVGGVEASYPALRTVQMAPGLGYWPGAIVEPHFSERGRIGRLVSALAQNPGLIALGVDANTAIEVAVGRGFEVIGEGTVTVLDGRNVRHDTIAAAGPDEPIALTDLTMHLLAGGWGYDLTKRVPHPPLEGV